MWQFRFYIKAVINLSNEHKQLKPEILACVYFVVNWHNSTGRNDNIFLKEKHSLEMKKVI